MQVIPKLKPRIKNIHKKKNNIKRSNGVKYLPMKPC